MYVPKIVAQQILLLLLKRLHTWVFHLASFFLKKITTNKKAYGKLGVEVRRFKKCPQKEKDFLKISPEARFIF